MATRQRSLQRSAEDAEDDTAGLVFSIIGNAVAPAGLEIVDELPPLDTVEEDLQNILIGKQVLVGWETVSKKGRTIVGRFVGVVNSRNLSTQDR